MGDIFVVSDCAGFVGAFASRDAAETHVFRKFSSVPFVLHRFPLAAGPSDRVWVVCYRDIDAVAFVSNDRDAAESVRASYAAVGQAYEEPIDFWVSPFGALSPPAAARLDAQQRAHEMYAGPLSAADVESLERADAARADKLGASDGSLERAFARHDAQVFMRQCVVPVGELVCVGNSPAAAGTAAAVVDVVSAGGGSGVCAGVSITVSGDEGVAVVADCGVADGAVTADCCDAGATTDAGCDAGATGADCGAAGADTDADCAVGACGATTDADCSVATIGACCDVAATGADTDADCGVAGGAPSASRGAAPRLEAANLAGITMLMNPQNTRAGVDLGKAEQAVMGCMPGAARAADIDPVGMYAAELSQLAEELGIDLLEDSAAPAHPAPLPAAATLALGNAGADCGVVGADEGVITVVGCGDAGADCGVVGADEGDITVAGCGDAGADCGVVGADEGDITVADEGDITVAGCGDAGADCGVAGADEGDAGAELLAARPAELRAARPAEVLVATDGSLPTPDVCVAL